MTDNKEIPQKNNSLKNFFSDFTTNLNERLRLPVFQYYLIILFFYNWDFILYLLYDGKPILTRIKYIKSNFYTADRYLIPLFLAIIYSVFFPILQFYLIKIQKNFDKKRILWNQELQTENANHKKSIQNILTGIKEKEDFARQIEFEKSKNIILQEEIEILRNENLKIQKNSNENINEVNELRQNYHILLSNFKYFLRNTSEVSKEVMEKYGDEKYFKYFNILIEMFKLNEINNNTEIENNFPNLLYDYLLNRENSVFSDNNLVDENIKKHISNVLLRNSITKEVSTQSFGNLITQSEEYKEFAEFVKDIYSI